MQHGIKNYSDLHFHLVPQHFLKVKHLCVIFLVFISCDVMLNYQSKITNVSHLNKLENEGTVKKVFKISNLDLLSSKSYLNLNLNGIYIQ